MNIYKLILVLIVASYGGLTGLAGAIQLKRRKINLISSLSMILGGLLIILSLVNFFTGYTVLVLIAGLIIIQCAAISNGFQMFHRINPTHHIIRLGISIFIIAISLLK